MAINEITKIFRKQKLDLSKFDSWQIKPYMKTFDTCAMDIKSFLKSKEVRNQYYIASKIIK